MTNSDAGAAGGLLDFDLATQKAFDGAYWLSFPKPIRDTFNPLTNPNEPFDNLKDKALAFSQQGFKIDVYIMLMRMDPYIIMRQRQDLGFSSVPAVGEMPVTLPPSLGGPTNAGSIKVSVNLADYPAYPEPQVPTPTNPTRSPIGPLLTGKTYLALMPESSSYHNGDSVNVNGKVYKLQFPNIFAPPYWIQQ